MQSDANHCMFKRCVNGVDVYLALIVDDGLVALESASVFDAIIVYLKGAFEITIGDATKFLGLQIECNRAQVVMFIHQADYVEKILEQFKRSIAKPVSVSADPHAVLYPAEDDDEGEGDVPLIVKP